MKTNNTQSNKDPSKLRQLPDPTDEEENSLPFDHLWEAQARVKMFQSHMFGKHDGAFDFRFYTACIWETCAFFDGDWTNRKCNLAKHLSADLPSDIEGKRLLRNRLRAAAFLEAVTANASLSKVEFDYSKLNDSSAQEGIEADFEWLMFVWSDFRGIEKDWELPEGDANLILNALATTPIYAGSKPGEVFMEVAPAAEVPGCEDRDVCTRLPRKCQSVLLMLNATGPWCDTYGRGAKVGTCRNCGERYLLDAALCYCLGLQNRHDSGAWDHPGYVCYKCLRFENQTGEKWKSPRKSQQSDGFIGRGL